MIAIISNNPRRGYHNYPLSTVNCPLKKRLPDVPVVEGVAAFGAELGGLGGILGLPAAFVAAVLGHSGGLFRAAFGAEFALVHRAAGADPPVGLGLFGTALGAELSGGGGTAGGTGPASRCLRRGFFRAALGAEFPGGRRAAGGIPSRGRSAGAAEAGTEAGDTGAVGTEPDPSSRPYSCP